MRLLRTWAVLSSLISSLLRYATGKYTGHFLSIPIYIETIIYYINLSIDSETLEPYSQSPKLICLTLSLLLRKVKRRFFFMIYFKMWRLLVFYTQTIHSNTGITRKSTRTKWTRFTAWKSNEKWEERKWNNEGEWQISDCFDSFVWRSFIFIYATERADKSF